MSDTSSASADFDGVVLPSDGYLTAFQTPLYKGSECATGACHGDGGSEGLAGRAVRRLNGRNWF